MKNNLQQGLGASAVLLVIAVIIIVGAYYFAQSVDEETSVIMEDKSGEVMMDKETATMMMETELTDDVMVKEMDEVMMKEMMTMTYQYSGVLADVTDGKIVRGIATDGASSGLAQANFADGNYDLLVTFADLSDPQGTDFYEGWIVRKGISFDVLSTGKVEKVDGIYTNTYRSGEDLTDHTFYVLTIEPDDDNPAPADHILEGTLLQ